MSADLKFKKVKEKFSVRITESESKTVLKIVGQKENVLAALETFQNAKLEMVP